jgi:type III pantothenate kinase
MIICIDSGNSRIKWGVHDGNQWCEQGVLTHAEIDQLGDLGRRWPQPKRVMLANVAGPVVGAGLRQVLAPWISVLHEAKSEAAQAGITNLYKNPARLGVDRWCALVGARRLGSSARLVVMAGTATTIDSLDADGNFLGGLILPGLETMRRALFQGTAALPFVDGVHMAYPRATADAIVTGCVEAQVGAIERAFARLAGEDATCILSGGHAEMLSDFLVIPHLLAHNLPLEGLLCLALES